MPFFTWLEALPFSSAIRASAAWSTTINLVHLLAIVMLMGTVLIVDLRLLGLAVTQQPVARVERDSRPWMIGALTVLLMTGILQLASTALKQYYSQFFWLKMASLGIVLTFTFTVRHWVAQSAEPGSSGWWRPSVGLISITLWLTVVVSGRLIGLLS